MTSGQDLRVEDESLYRRPEPQSPVTNQGRGPGLEAVRRSSMPPEDQVEQLAADAMIHMVSAYRDLANIDPAALGSVGSDIFTVLCPYVCSALLVLDEFSTALSEEIGNCRSTQVSPRIFEESSK